MSVWLAVLPSIHPRACARLHACLRVHMCVLWAAPCCSVASVLFCANAIATLNGGRSFPPRSVVLVVIVRLYCVRLLMWACNNWACNKWACYHAAV